MNEFRGILKGRIKVLNMFLGLLTLGAIGVILPAVYITPYFIIILFLYIAIIYIPAQEVFYEKKQLQAILIKSHRDKYQALHDVQVEMEDITETLHAPKTEMDVHAFNATDEYKAMRAAKSNERSLKKKLGFYTRLNESLSQEIKDTAHIEEDQYQF